MTMPPSTSTEQSYCHEWEGMFSASTSRAFQDINLVTFTILACTFLIFVWSDLLYRCVTGKSLVKRLWGNTPDQEHDWVVKMIAGAKGDELEAYEDALVKARGKKIF